jgi:SHAQKYF class myb-like DNA-binding protein
MRDETELAARLFDLKALDEKAQAVPKSRAPKNGLNMSKKCVLVRKRAADAKQQHAERSDASTGKWTDQEHETFLQGLVSHGVGAKYDWKSIQQMVPGRTLIQIRTHAQKHFKKQQ